jgi:EAL domain-containing protein (putative c-di-GMP-specific phosphodiesterase class I)
MDLIRGIDRDPVRRVILRNTLNMLADLNITPLCEGVETADELSALRDLGVNLMQGYLLAKPAFESITVPSTIADVLAPAA